MAIRFDGQAVVVAGAGRGLGAAYARLSVAHWQRFMAPAAKPE